MIRPLLLVLLTLLPCVVSARDSLRYDVEAVSVAATGANTPFWLVNNRDGLGSVKRYNGYLRAAAFVDGDTARRFSWNAGADLVGAYGMTSHFIIEQLYAGINYRSVFVYAGSRIEDSGTVDRRLSSGDLLYSGNALPMPQVRAGLSRFVPVPLTNDWLHIRGYVAYGLFTDGSWQTSFAGPDGFRTDNVLYNSKGIWFRIGRQKTLPLHFTLGLEMGTQFGGKYWQNGKWNHMPTKLKDWFKAFIPGAGGSDTPIGEQTNVYGNHTGEWTFSLDWTPSGDDNWQARAYYEHYFEDHSMMFFDYKWRDGLLGFQLTPPSNPWLQSIVYEYLYTKDQSGAVYWDHDAHIPEQVSGRDNYYNHGLYVGWEHWGMGLGNPLLISPVYNADRSLRFKHNRIIAHHVGIAGRPTAQVEWRLLVSHTRSWGTYDSPTAQVLHNFTIMTEGTYSPRKLRGWSGTLSLGLDHGNLIGNSFGAQISIRKTGLL